MAAVPSIGRASLVEVPARSAQAAATEGLYERHSAKILGYCMHQLGSREEAEDAVQTTFMNAFRALGRGVVPESESAWLFKIAENVCLSRRRSSWRRGRIESPSDFEVIEEIVPGPSRQRDELIGIEDALASMPDQQRRAILLREWQGLSYREIADELEVSQSAVETLIFRARRSLAQGLEQPELQRKPKRKGLRRALHIVDFGTVLAAAKTLLAGSAAVKATAAAVAVTAAAGTAAGVKNEGHSPKPAEAKPAAVAPAPKAAPPPAEAPASVVASVQSSPAAASVVPRRRPAVITPARKAVKEKAAATKPATSASAPAAPATPPPATAPPTAAAPAQPEAPVAPPPAPVAQPEPAQPPVVVAPPAPVDARPEPRAGGRKTREERRQEQQERRQEQQERRQEQQERREERRNRARQAAAEPHPAPSAIVAVVAPAPPAPEASPADPEESSRDRHRGRRWQQRDLASLTVVDPAAIVQETTADTVVADPAAAPEAEQAEEPERHGRGRGRRG